MTDRHVFSKCACSTADRSTHHAQLTPKSTARFGPRLRGQELRSKACTLNGALFLCMKIHQRLLHEHDTPEVHL
jgi:hypothetical protein